MTTLDAAALGFHGEPVTPSAKIQRLSDIPDVRTLPCPVRNWLVDGLIRQRTITLWSGPDGVGKSFLLQKLVIEVSRGGTFLGRQCTTSPVLYIDFENDQPDVTDRIEVMAGDPEETPLPNLHIWGPWSDPPPPMIGSDILLTIAKEEQPLIVIDPLRNAHNGDENSSGEMSAIMQQLVIMTKLYGSTVILLHHVAKTEGSGYRGSTAIRGAVDLAIVQEQDEASGLLILKTQKRRFAGPPNSITIRTDLENGIFEPTDHPMTVRREDEVAKLVEIITVHPGLTTNKITKLAIPMQRRRCQKILGEGIGKHWTTEKGPRNSVFFYPIDWFLRLTEPVGTSDPVGHGLTGALAPTPKGWASEPVAKTVISLVPNRLVPDENLCSKHKFHREWIDAGGVLVCLKCEAERPRVVV